ncbi:MAG: SDR family NAD(P)-dependent oxidoreductase [Bdellovibrionota bacterium]
MLSTQKLAIVTGASSGIGADISRHFKSEMNLEIWLVARRLDRMQSLAAELEAKGATIKVLSLDLQKAESWAELEAQVKMSGRKVAWLVNNAGFGYSGHFSDESLENIEGMIQLNVIALTSVTRRLLPFMESGSRIVNVASSIAFLPVAGNAIYAATKAFVLSFSLALRVELRARGISVSAVCPGPVGTEFWDVAGTDAPSKMFIENSTNTAFLSVEKSAQGKAIIVTGFLAWIARVAGAVVPRTWLADLTVKRLNKNR